MTTSDDHRLGEDPLLDEVKRRLEGPDTLSFEEARARLIRGEGSSWSFRSWARTIPHGMEEWFEPKRTHPASGDALWFVLDPETGDPEHDWGLMITSGMIYGYSIAEEDWLSPEDDLLGLQAQRFVPLPAGFDPPVGLTLSHTLAALLGWDAAQRAHLP